MPESNAEPTLELRFLGEIAVLRDGHAAALPPSRTTRALLAYLVLTGRPHRREHLCELLWNGADDAAAELRRSLTELRALVDTPGCERLRADRETVAFVAEGARIDVLRARAAAEHGFDRLTTSALRELADAFRGELLAGLDLADRLDFHAWCAAERERARALHERVLRALAPRLEDGATSSSKRSQETAVPEPRPPRGSFPTPATRYARSGDVNIAYQVLGEGPDMVVIPGWVSHVEQAWEVPAFAAFLRRLASFARVMLFDRRGTGMSDRVASMPTLEQRMDDIRAVMDAAGSERAALFGISEGGPLGMLFAATYPERTTALALYGTFARGSWHEDYPWRWKREQWDQVLDYIGREWGKGKIATVLAPSIGSDAQQIEQWARFERLAVSPGGAQTLFRMTLSLDVRHVLPAIHTPTVVLQRTGDRITTPPGARYIAEHIPGARYVELPGDDHFPWIGDAEAIAGEVQELVTGHRVVLEPDRVLATVMFVDIVDSTGHVARLGDRAWRELLTRFRALVRMRVAAYRGREVDTQGDSLLATFDGPARAVRCARAVCDAVAPLGIRVRAGLHTGECEMLGSDVTGIAVHIGARVAEAADPDEVLVSSTVKDLVAGSGIEFSSRGTHALQGVPGEWTLFRAETA